MHDRDLALAGGVAVTLAVGLAELAAWLLPGAPSPLDAVGQLVVRATPGPVVRWAIDTLGSANRTVLAVSIIVVVLLIGLAVGRTIRRGLLPAAVVFVGGAGFAVWAMLRQPGAVLPTSLIAVVAAVVVGLTFLSRARSLAVDRRPDDELPTVPTDREPQQHPTGSTPDATPVSVPPAAVDRRRFLALAAGASVTGVAAFASGRGWFSGPMPSTPASTGQSRLPVADITLPPVAPEQDLATRVDGVSEVLTPNDRFYRIDTAVSVPTIASDDWTLRVEGMVDSEVELTYAELLDQPLRELDATIACVSNEVGGDLIGTARWLGVPLLHVLELAGIDPAAEQVVGRSVDGWTAGFPIEVLDADQAIVAIGMNGEPLPARHGFPARLIVPGLFGYVSATKWLEAIELTTWDGFDGYWIPRGWAKRGPVKTGSRIDRPRGSVDRGRVTVAGVAWAPTRGIEMVEVRVDDGSWRPATLVPPLADTTWVQWHLDVDLGPGRHQLSVRATDGDGELQSEGPVGPVPSGAEGWHTVAVRGL